MKAIRGLTGKDSCYRRLSLLRNYGHFRGTKMTVLLFWFSIKWTPRTSHITLLSKVGVCCSSFVKLHFKSNVFLSGQLSLLHRHCLCFYYMLKCLYGRQGFYSYGSSIMCKKILKKKKIGFWDFNALVIHQQSFITQSTSLRVAKAGNLKLDFMAKSIGIHFFGVENNFRCYRDTKT